MSLRTIETMFSRGSDFKAVVRFNPNFDEYETAYYQRRTNWRDVPGSFRGASRFVRLADCDGFTDCKRDAIGTARLELNRLAQS